MKKLTFILFFFPAFLLGQVFHKVITPKDTFYVLNSIDSISIPKGLPDGKWKVFFENDTSKPEYIFFLKDNKVNGYFMSFYPSGYWETRGSYKDDSLWTFRTDEFGGNDTTFKIAKWEYQASGYVKERLNKIPYYNNDSIYLDNWYYKDGQLLSERIYHKRKGLIKEIWFYENGEKSFLLEQQKDYSIITQWTKDQKITSIDINQNFSFYLQLDTNDIKFYNRCKDCICQQIDDRNGKNISTIWIDSKGKIRGFSCSGVSLNYDDEANVKSITYWNRKNKFRIKRLK
jgi:antitoxin component YwqK of YwqJK toxin-antitoxin module